MRFEDYLDYDWKTLLILDAFRFDVFEKVFDWGVDYKKANTGVNYTQLWYRKYWNDQVPVDLISSNPQPWNGKSAHSKGGAEQFFNMAQVAWDDDTWVDLEHTIEVYKDKVRDGTRTLLHTMPPHLPWIGEKGIELMSRLDIVYDDRVKNREVGTSIYKIIEKYGREGHWEEVRDCYAESAKRALDIVRDNLGVFKKPLIITSDHGELMGEVSDKYDHPSQCHDFEAQVLYQVPWVRMEENIETRSKIPR